jgi:uncharacterized protein (TIGR00251 family)
VKAVFVADLDALKSAIQVTSTGVLIRVFVQPKARREQVVGLHGDRLKLAVTEPPDKGKANAAVIRLLAEVLQVAPSKVELLRGDTSRQKDLVVSGLSLDATLSRLASHIP